MTDLHGTGPKWREDVETRASSAIECWRGTSLTAEELARLKSFLWTHKSSEQPQEGRLVRTKPGKALTRIADAISELCASVEAVGGTEAEIHLDAAFRREPYAKHSIEMRANDRLADAAMTVQDARAIAAMTNPEPIKTALARLRNVEAEARALPRIAAERATALKRNASVALDFFESFIGESCSGDVDSTTRTSLALKFLQAASEAYFREPIPDDGCGSVRGAFEACQNEWSITVRRK